MTTKSFLSFHLSDEFVEKYANTPVPWGFQIGAGNSLAELTFITKYSRLKEDGSKERWHEVCRRVVEGMFSIQKDHCLHHKIPWNAQKARRAAEDAFDRMFQFKWTPPGRGLEFMGTQIVNGENNAGPLQNCAMLSTEHLSLRNPTMPFTRLMEMSMTGIGCGFDTLGAGKLTIHKPSTEIDTFVVDDSREGWAESVGLLLKSYFLPEQNTAEFDYSQIRPEGSPLKRFGKTASGPRPLQLLHLSLRKQFDNRDGEQITSTDIVDVMNKIGKAVVAGSTRRSAEIALGFADDKEFLQLKDWEVNPERMGADGWGYLSNNSVMISVGEDINHIIEGIVKNGEPGIIWLDLARGYGRMSDPRNDRDYRIAGFNPCVTADTWTMTSEGPRKVKDLISIGQFDVLVNGKPYTVSSDGFWLTDTDREVFDLITSDGWTARMTSNHQVMTTDGWKEARDLVPGDEIILHDHENTTWHGRGNFSEGYLLGHLWGDGYLAEHKAVLSLWGNQVSMKDWIQEQAAHLPHRSDWAGFTPVSGRDEWRLTSRPLVSLANSFGMFNGSKKISDEIERAGSDFYIGFLRAAFDTDGHVEENSSEGGISIRLSQSDREQLERVQRMLGRLGILSTIRSMRESGLKEMPGGEFWVKASWRLIISGSDTQRFMSRIGFQDEEKSQKYWDAVALMKRGFYRKQSTTRFVALESAGLADVYDVSVYDVNAFDANGLYVHNCGEQGLEHNELCTLVELFPTNHESLADFLKTVKVAYLYGKSVTLLPTLWPESNEVMQRNRRIGLSMTGVAQFADSRGWNVLKDWCNSAYSVVNQRDTIYSEWLGVRESIKKTTVKPSGTVSLVGSVWPGVHWPVAAGRYLRRQRFRTSDPMVKIFTDAGYPIEPDVMDPEFTVVVTFPTSGPSGRSQRDVSLWEKMALAAMMGKYWSDNAVSATFTFSPQEEDQIAPAIRAYEGQLKTMSFLPMGEEGENAYAQMPYESVSDEIFDSMLANIKPIDWQSVYASMDDADGDRFCDSDSCII